MTAAALRIPRAATMRLYQRHEQFPHLIVIASAGGYPSPEAVSTTAGGLTVMLTHAGGCTWPDGRGEALLAAALERGGNAILAFERLQDALACREQLEVEPRR